MTQKKQQKKLQLYMINLHEKHRSALLSMGVLRELENYIDTVSTRDHARHHGKAVMTALKCMSECVQNERSIVVNLNGRFVV